MASSASLAETKAYLREGFDIGVECPACGQFVKRYKRTITSAMAYGLCLIVKDYEKRRDAASEVVTTWIHIENFFKGIPDLPSSIRGDISKLRYWDILEKMEAKREDGSPRNGYYKLTKQGYKFVKGYINMPKYAVIYNNKFIGLKGEALDIKQALGNKFNYSELMGNAEGEPNNEEV